MRVAADGGNELVAGRRLRSRKSMFIEKFLQIGVGPRAIQPVARIGSIFTALLGNTIVVLTSCGQQRVTSTWLRVRDAVMIQE